MSINANVERAKEDYDRTFEAGKQAEYDAFWDAYQNYGNRTHYSGAFKGLGWNDVSFKPKYNLTPIQGSQMFQETRIIDVEAALQKAGVTLDTSNATSLLQMFQSSTVKIIPRIDASKSTNNGYIFNCDATHIREFVVSEQSHFGLYMFPSVLKEIKITGVIANNGFSMSNCTVLSKASIESVVAALSDTTTGLSVTFNKKAVNKAFETAEGANDGSTSAEWLALVATRSNWTIALA